MNPSPLRSLDLRRKCLSQATKERRKYYEKKNARLIGYFAGWVVRTLIYMLFVTMVVKYAISTGVFTDRDAVHITLRNTKTCLEIAKLSRELSQEVINQVVIHICAELIQEE